MKRSASRDANATSLAGGYHLHTDAGGLSLPCLHPGHPLSQDRRVVDGEPHEDGARGRRPFRWRYGGANHPQDSCIIPIAAPSTRPSRSVSASKMSVSFLRWEGPGVLWTTPWQRASSPP